MISFISRFLIRFHELVKRSAKSHQKLTKMPDVAWCDTDAVGSEVSTTTRVGHAIANCRLPIADWPVAIDQSTI